MRYRSATFDRYLMGLRYSDPKRYRQILDEEAKFLDNWHQRLHEAETVAEEQMTGYGDTPAGPSHRINIHDL